MTYMQQYSTISYDVFDTCLARICGNQDLYLNSLPNQF